MHKRRLNARQAPVEYAEAIYHLLSCGDHREVIVGDAKAARFALPG
jgi:hypothetical protein